MLFYHVLLILLTLVNCAYLCFSVTNEPYITNELYVNNEAVLSFTYSKAKNDLIGNENFDKIRSVHYMIMLIFVYS